MSSREVHELGKRKQKKILNIILLGNTGSGKSSTGNTILRRNAFISHDAKSGTENCQLECSEFEDRIIRVVDTPGLMNAKMSNEKILKRISNAMCLCPEGFSALVYVIAYGLRFTEEEESALELLAKLFGDQFLSQHGIVIMTRGDHFELLKEEEEESYTFQDWLNKRTGPPEFMNLLETCEKRIVLFYNVGGMYKEQREQSLNEFLQIVDSIPSPYTSEIIYNGKRYKKTINILLVGKTGHGKSATGNTILKREAFTTSDGLEAYTEYGQLENMEIGDELLRVVDTPGLVDTRVSPETVIQRIFYSMSLCPQGFNAVVFVMSYGMRFTSEEKQVLDTLRAAFGETFVRDYCVIILTKGDQFDFHNEKKKNFTFENWLSQQKESEDFKNLLDECGGRVFLFYNVSERFKAKRKTCRKQFIEFLKLKQGVYFSDRFQICGQRRQELTDKLDLPSQKLYAQDSLSLVRQFIHLAILNLDGKKKQKDKRGHNICVKSHLENVDIILETLEDHFKKDMSKNKRIEEFINKIERIRGQVKFIQKITCTGVQSRMLQYLDGEVKNLKIKGSWDIFKGFLVTSSLVGGGIIGGSVLLAASPAILVIFGIRYFFSKIFC